MKRNVFTGVLGAVLVLALVLVGCKKDPPGENVNDPQWVFHDAQHPHMIAVVFVHGIFGDTKGTWTADPNDPKVKSFFDYVHEAPGIGDQVDIYAFGFSSHMIKDGSLRIGEAAIKLNDYLQRQGIDKYDQIVFVGHSMGGLITMRELISHPELRAKVPLLVFYATPQQGTQITQIAKHIVNNDAVRQMLPVDKNDYLDQLVEDWVNVRKTSPRPWMICAYETMPVKGVMIVPKSSARMFCDDNASAMENSDHITIVKPDRATHPSVTVLLNALDKFAIASLTDATWETQKFEKNQDKWTYVIENAGKRNTATFENGAGLTLPYEARSLDTGLVVDPRTMPRFVVPNANDAIDLLLMNPLKQDYRLSVRLGHAPERIVTVHIPDMARAIAQRNEVEVGRAQFMSAYFDDAGNKGAFNQLTPPDRHAKLLSLATTAIEQQQPGLPESARLVLAADTLAWLNLPDSAAYALSTVETKFPEMAKSAGVQRLGAVVATRTGKANVLAPTVRPPSVTAEEALKPVDLSTATAAQRRDLSVFADHLRTIPATAAEGNVLKGDVLTASGDEAAAARVYTEAQRVEATPVVRDRLRRASAVIH
jgi:hypothetical protein